MGTNVDPIIFIRFLGFDGKSIVDTTGAIDEVSY